MASDKDCEFNINGLCYEMVTHGFSEKQLRDWGRMKPCDMGISVLYGETKSFSYCPAYQGHYESAVSTPGIISPLCVDAVRNARWREIVDGEIIDLESTL